MLALTNLAKEVSKHGCISYSILLFFIKSQFNYRFAMNSDIKRYLKRSLAKRAKILGHFDKQSTTYLIWRDPHGKIFSEKVITLAKHKTFLRQLSNKDAFLFGYLLGAEHEKFT